LLLNNPKTKYVIGILLETIGEIKTGIDRFLDLINTDGETKIDIAAKKLGVPSETIEIWAEILQQDNLIDIDYDSFGKMTTKPKVSEQTNKIAGEKHPVVEQKEEKGRGFSILKNLKKKSAWKKNRETKNKERYLKRLKLPAKNEKSAPKENVLSKILKRLGMKKQK